MDKEKLLRDHLLYLLDGGGAHLSYEEAIADIPSDYRGKKVSGSPHTLWRLQEHLRLCQWDILEFSINPNHVSPEFPDGYWPRSDGPDDDAAWDQSLKSFHQDLQAMKDLVTNPGTDLYQPIPHGEGQTLLREALLVADHNAYHLGQIVMLRRLLGIWQE